jgi:hypothetical protein
MCICRLLNIVTMPLHFSICASEILQCRVVIYGQVFAFLSIKQQFSFGRCTDFNPLKTHKTVYLGSNKLYCFRIPWQHFFDAHCTFWREKIVNVKRNFTNAVIKLSYVVEIMRKFLNCYLELLQE